MPPAARLNVSFFFGTGRLPFFCFGYPLSLVVRLCRPQLLLLSLAKQITLWDLSSVISAATLTHILLNRFLGQVEEIGIVIY